MLQGKKVIGHPVDVATGTVYSTHEDISIPGKVDLTWERRYSTALLEMPPSPLGHGWTTRYFATLTQSKGEFQFITPEGEIEIFADPEGTVDRGGSVRNLGTFQELAKQDERYIVTLWDVDTGEIERYVFKEGRKGETWLLASIEGVTGQGLDLLRDEAGRITGIQQRLEKRTLLIEYTSGNRISSVSFLMPDNQQQVLARYTYNKNGRLRDAYDALGYADSYKYDSKSRMIQEILRDGSDFYFKYDDKGRCVKTSGLDRFDEKTFRYLDHIGWTEVTNSYGHVTRFQWLPSGQVVCQIDPLGAEKKTEFDEEGRIITEIDSNGVATKYEYDDQGNRCKIIQPQNRVSLIGYTENHQPLAMTDPAGNVWKREYDYQNRWIASLDPLGNRYEYKYNGRGQLVEIKNPEGARREFSYSPNGDLIAATDWRNNLTRFAVDEFGRMTRQIDPLGNETRLQYDLLGNIMRIYFPDETALVCQYDAGGNLDSVIDGEGRSTKFQFGACGQIIKEIDPDGNVVQYEWGSEPNLLQEVINEKGDRYSFVYDEALQVVREVGFDGRQLDYQRDLKGQCSAVVNGLGERIAYTYDELGRLTGKTFPDGKSVTFEYDVHGNIVYAANDSIEITMEQDAHGQLIRENQGPHIIENEYNAVGDHIRTATSLGFRIQYEYDSNGDLRSFTTDQGHSIRSTRNELGLETKRFLPGGVKLMQQYDSIGRLREQKVGASGQRPSPGQLTGDGTSVFPLGKEIVRRSYSYDRSDNLIQIRDGHWGESYFEYDPGEHLIRSIRENASEAFHYDETGNIGFINTISRNKQEDEELIYGPGNRLLRQGDTKFVYDNNGRLINKIESADSDAPKTWVYEWDGDDQLVSMTRPDGEIWRYDYDPFGRRIAKHGPNTSRFYIWQGDVILHELDGDTVEATWVFDPHSFSPLAKLQDGEIFSVITDHIGSPREMLDQTGKVVWRAISKSWGIVDEFAVQEVDCPIRFPGQWFDNESGLHYNLHRYYDPNSGHFICLDPIGLFGGLNEYIYADNPVNWIDPFGLNECNGDDEATKKRVIKRRNISRRHSTRKRALDAAKKTRQPQPKKGASKKKRDRFREQQKYRKPERHPDTAHPEPHVHDSNKSTQPVNVHHDIPR